MKFRSFLTICALMAMSAIMFAFSPVRAEPMRYDYAYNVYKVDKIAQMRHDLTVAIARYDAQSEAAFFLQPDISILANRTHDGRLPFDIRPRYALTIGVNPLPAVDLRWRC